MENMTATKSELVKVALELNSKLGLNPNIPTKKVKTESLIQLIKEAVSMIHPEDDEGLLEIEPARIIIDKMSLELSENVIKPPEQDVQDVQDVQEEEPGQEPETPELEPVIVKVPDPTPEPLQETDPDPTPEPDEMDHADGLAIMKEIQKITKMRALKKFAVTIKPFEAIALSEFKGPKGVEELKGVMFDIISAKSGVTYNEIKPPRKGVIRAIAEMIEHTETGVTKKEIHEQLKAMFPERNPDSMWKSINLVVPSNIKRDWFPVNVTKRGKEGVYMKSPNP